MCLAATGIAAQVRWESLAAARRHKVLASRSLHESVRRLCDADCQCDAQTVDEAVSQMTMRCKDRNRAALYMFLYDRLHEQRQVDAATDAVMLQLHAEQLLARLGGDDDRAMCRWAYTLARRYMQRGGAEAFDNDLRRALGRRAKRYAETCRTLSGCVRTALGSFEAGGRALPDMTEPRRTATGFVPITREEYAAETAAACILAMPADSLPSGRSMYDELLWRDGVYCISCHSPWPGVECVACMAGAGGCVVLTGSDGVGVTLPMPVEFTPSGMLFSVGEESVMAAAISPDATVEQIGFAPLPRGRLLHAKCSDEAVSVEMETPLGSVCYQWLPRLVQ